ncbi:MAG: aminoglycoside phosphotransferase family protein [Planctomycetota bacterium]|jgi:hypothetical protein
MLRVMLLDEMRPEVLREPPRADSPDVYRLRDPGGSVTGILYVAREANEQMVDRMLDRADAVRSALGEPLGQRVVREVWRGDWQGRRAAVFPYYQSLETTQRLIYRMLRRRMRRHLYEWLHAVLQASRRDIDDTADARRALTFMREEAGVSSPIQDEADRLLDRLARGAWVPSTSVMHQDLWLGNVLLMQPYKPASFVVIDWAGSQLRGWPLFDLLRLVASMGDARNGLRELARHVQTLGGEPQDASGAVLCALGGIGLDLEHFPPSEYREMCERTWSWFRRLTP